MAEVDLSVINHDELNCPACFDQAMMEVKEFCGDALPSAACIQCPECGFQVVSRHPLQAEAAIRTLWAYMPSLDDVMSPEECAVLLEEHRS